MRLLLFLRAYANLLRFEFYVSRGNFRALHERVRKYPVATRTRSADTIEHACSAIDSACIWYFKEVRCLQRSAATTCLLRKHGFAARLVLGAKQMPFRAHAWVEINNQVINDKPYILEIYGVLDRC